MAYNISMIILMGLAGSGKSTQGQILAREMGREWLSAGEVLRREGRFREILDRGELVDNDLVIRIMAEEMARIIRGGKNIILDGFPRDIEQAKWMAENIATEIEGVLQIEVPKQELVRRIQLRGREDDTEEALKKRFQIVEQNIYTVCEILKKKGVKVAKVNGLGSVEEVTEQVRQTLKGMGIL